VRYSFPLPKCNRKGCRRRGDNMRHQKTRSYALQGRDGRREVAVYICGRSRKAEGLHYVRIAAPGGEPCKEIGWCRYAWTDTETGEELETRPDPQRIVKITASHSTPEARARMSVLVQSRPKAIFKRQRTSLKRKHKHPVEGPKLRRKISDGVKLAAAKRKAKEKADREELEDLRLRAVLTNGGKAKKGTPGPKGVRPDTKRQIELAAAMTVLEWPKPNQARVFYPKTPYTAAHNTVEFYRRHGHAVRQLAATLDESAAQDVLQRHQISLPISVGHQIS